MSRLIRAAVACAGFALLAPAAALGSFPGQDGVIAYSAEGHIWAVNPASGGQAQLTSGPNDSAPSFSPSGNALAFQREVGHTITIYLAQADGAEAHPLVAGSEPAFSPDGREIVFVRPGGLYVTGVTPGSPVRRLTSDPGDSEPRWSSTGTIAFTRMRTTGRHHRKLAAPALELLTPPSQHVFEVLALTGFEEPEGTLRPDWSPDGGTLVVSLCFPFSHATRHLEGRPPSLPAVVLRTSCTTAVWAPDGHGLAEAGEGTLAGVRQSSCPAPKELEVVRPIAWQPVVSATAPVATAACAHVSRIETEVSPSVSGNATLCVKSPRLHRLVCVK